MHGPSGDAWRLGPGEMCKMKQLEVGCIFVVLLVDPGGDLVFFLMGEK